MLRFFCGEVYPLAVNPEFTVLLDVYGNVLTEKERAMLDYYYNDDLSLREISDNENAERRARRNSGEQPPRENDTITRQGLVRRNRELLQLTADIRKNAEKAAVRAYQARAPKEIITAASDIDTLAEKIEELLR